MQKFVSGLLGVADDMERALESVPADAQQHKDPAALLQGLRGGIALTNKTLEKVSRLTCLFHPLPGWPGGLVQVILTLHRFQEQSAV